MPARIGHGNGQPCSTDSAETVNAEKPANVIWASEIWPTNPVRTTIDRQTTIPISVLARAPRNAGVNQNSPAMAARSGERRPAVAQRPRRRGRGVREPPEAHGAALGQRVAAQEQHGDDDDQGDQQADAGERLGTRHEGTTTGLPRGSR